MSIKRMPIPAFMAELRAACDRKDGYIMGATGQDPKKWSASSWWFTQYSGKQKTKALYWREHAARVWDCNGLAEGIYKDYAGVNINTKARYNYSGWCGAKGKGMIPKEYRVPGAAVFWGEKAGTIRHVAYLDRPVKENQPEGDWYIIEARGVMYGVVRTRLLSRKPNFWGIMDKYFDYGDQDYVPAEPEPGERILKNGMEGADVKAMQENLLALDTAGIGDYDLGKYGADGEFGDCTELAVMQFQLDRGLEADGEYGPLTHAAMLKALESIKTPEAVAMVAIKNGQCWVRIEPKVDDDNRIGVAERDTQWPYAGERSENGWLKINYKGTEGWVSPVFGRLFN